MTVNNYFKSVSGTVVPFDSRDTSSTRAAWERACAEYEEGRAIASYPKDRALKPCAWRAFAAEVSDPWYGADLVGFASAQRARAAGPPGAVDFEEFSLRRREAVADVEREWTDRRVS